jgi:hypothetical protein
MTTIPIDISTLVVISVIIGFAAGAALVLWKWNQSLREQVAEMAEVISDLSGPFDDEDDDDGEGDDEIRADWRGRRTKPPTLRSN